MPPQVLHVVQQLSRGGAARALVATAACAGRNGRSEHRIVSLLPVDEGARRLAADAQIPILARPASDALNHAVAEADILQIHYWNTPELLEFLRGLTGPTRLLLWSHVAGDTPPHLLPRALVEWADMTVVSGPYSCTLPVLTELDEDVRGARTTMILDTPDFSRLRDLEPSPHPHFNVGYIGTVDPVKMHPDYVQMSAAVDVPDVRFIVCGSGGGFERITQQIVQRGVTERFELRGYVEDVASVFAVLDVFGYPVIHSSAELVLQEAMFAGTPPVVLSVGGAPFMVRHGETGLVVKGTEEYTAAVEWLYHHPAERRRLGANAAAHARQVFGAHRAGDALHDVYSRLMPRPKESRNWPFVVDAGGTPASSAWRFLDLLDAATSRPFRISLTSTAWEDLLEAEAAIADAPPMMVDAASGGVLHYRRCSPDAAHLRLWSGLALRAQGRPALALAELDAARRLGLDHWRVSWYMAEVAQSIGAIPLAVESLMRVAQAAPAFTPASQALAALGHAS